MKMNDDKYYAVRNLQTIKENIAAYASYARHSINYNLGDLDDKIEKAQKSLQTLINFIINN